MKGRKVISTDSQRFGTEIDSNLSIKRITTETMQQAFIISTENGTITVSLRTAIDLVRRLQVLVLDSLVDAMLLFVKRE